ncbi:protein kinase [bacterium]|nr:protein kinase [bacterium]MCI0604741.1 protein kinase [bacterium]
MAHDQFSDLLIGYALDEQPEEVRLRVLAHLESGCDTCTTELKNIQETLHKLPLSLPVYSLPASVKMRIDQQIEDEMFHDKDFHRQSVSHYRLMRRLGIGGMGEVFLAEDTKLGRSAAIKLIRPEGANQERKKRFLREARAAAVLSHPGIATIYEVGEDGGTDFIAMEYVEGHSLKEELREQPLDLERIIRLGIQLADALSEAHERGILHRDLKPENIQIRKLDQLKILDFGLAKFLETRLEDDYTSSTDAVVGTIPYMSPEQIEGKFLDARSDLFSAGSLLYEMATGRAPFTGENPGATLQNILNCNPAPPSSLNPQIPSSLQKIIARCLQRDPALRYPSAKELVADLTLLEKGKSIDFARPVTSIARPAISIAVLYFENLSEERESDYFRAGMTEDIITELSKLKGWEVRPRTQVVPYKDQEIHIKDIASELKVTHILQGSIRKAGSRLRISAQLVETRTASSMWAERYDRDLQDIFEIQSEIAQKIAVALKVHLTKSEKQEFAKRYTENLEAYDSYLRGREMIFRLSKEGVEGAIDYFLQAVQADPKYALAHAGLAQAYAISLSFYGGPESLADQSIVHAGRALALEKNLPQAYAALGLAYFLKRMIEDAREACSKAVQLDPYDPFATWISGRLLYRMNQYEESAERFRKTIELLPDFYTAYADLSQAYENMGMHEIAIETRKKTIESCRKYVQDFPNEARARIFLATSYAWLDAQSEAIAEGKRAADLSPKDPVLMYNLACLFSLLNEKEEAVHWLSKSIQLGRRDFEWMKRDPELENIRNHPAYLALINQ